MSLGQQAAEALVDGFAALSGRGTALPLGYDAGVLHSVRDIGHILKEGINSIEFETKKRRADRKQNYDCAFKEKVVRRIREPITSSCVETCGSPAKRRSNPIATVSAA